MAAEEQIPADLKCAAEIWRRQLSAGMAPLCEAVAWADGLIARLDEPPYWLIAVSMADGVEEALRALEDVKGQVDRAEVWAMLLGNWRELLERHPERDSDIARALYGLAAEGDVPAPGLEGEMMSFWDAIDLARDGIHGVLEEERARLMSFLARWSAPLTQA